MELILGLGLSIILLIGFGIFGCIATLDLIEYKNNEYKKWRENEKK